MEDVDSGAAVQDATDATDGGTGTELPGHTIERMVSTRDVTGEAAENLRIEQKSMVKK